MPARVRYYLTGYEVRGDVVVLKGDQAVLFDDPLDANALAGLCTGSNLDPNTWPKVETPEGNHYFLTPADAATVAAAIADYPGLMLKQAGDEVPAAGSPDCHWDDAHPDLPREDGEDWNVDPQAEAFAIEIVVPLHNSRAHHIASRL